jgi:phospholipase C
MVLSRRAALARRAAVLASIAGIAGCHAPSHPDSSAGMADAAPDTAPRAPERAACTYQRGALAADTLDPGTPLGTQMPIDNIVVVMMENHSFDNYLGHLNQYANRTDIESAPDTATNVDSQGQTVSYVHSDHLCVLDPDHSWGGTRREIDDGLMDGFAAVNDGYNLASLPAGQTDPTLSSGARTVTWYDQRDLPFYYQLAATYSIADHYFAAVPGPTWPNRMFLYAATSFGQTTNFSPDLSAYPYPQYPVSILDELEQKGISWMLYTDGIPGAFVLQGESVYSMQRWKRPVVASIAQFQADAAAGTLPEVAFVDPDLLSEIMAGAGTDEHPPGDIQEGEQFVSQAVQAVTSSPQWPHLALFVTHDEHGGFYDHVPPPEACAPDGIPPNLDPGDMTQGGFDIEGVRVILIAVSPYSKPAYAGHHVYDHTSLTRFIEQRYDLPALTARDANAETPVDLFDFSQPAFATPATLTPPPVDSAGHDYCVTTFGD